MIIIDANLLIYARSTSFPQHDVARNWLDDRLNEGGRVALPWESLIPFLRILSHPRIVERPEAIESLWKQVDAWLALEVVWVPTPTDRHAEILSSLAPLISRPNLVHDAHLAALAISHGLTLMSTDGDFARFPGLRWENPLRQSNP